MVRLLAVLVGGLLLLATAQAAQAGGWATVTVDGWPEQWVAGKGYTLGVTVRAHGVRPASVGDRLMLEAHNTTGEGRVSFAAQATDKNGYYEAVVTLPTAGIWRVTVGKGDYMETTVTTRVAEPGVFSSELVRWWLALPAVALVAGAVVVRRRVGWRLWVAGSVAVPIALVVLTLRAAPSQAAEQARYGQELFVVKGCARCHVHDQAEVDWSTQMGPELSAYQPDAAWLRRWLADPTALRPNTLMPNLELAPHEIDALIAFLQAE